MTVGELIKELQKYDPDDLVLQSGQESDYNTIRFVEPLVVQGPYKAERWEGEYIKCREEELLKQKAVEIY